MRKYNINASITLAIENLYNKDKKAVLFNGFWFRSILGVIKGCLLSSTLFNIFLSGALEDHKGSVSTGGRIFINFRLADGIVVNAEEIQEADDIVTSMPVYNLYKVQDCDWA